MELKDFVCDTIIAISNGIIKAQEKSKDSGLIIAPPLTESGTIQIMKEGIKKPHIIHFNLKVAVEASGEQKDGKGSFSVQVLNFNFSSESAKNVTSFASSYEIQEISFDIPVLWPTNAPQSSPIPIAPREYDPFKS